MNRQKLTNISKEMFWASIAIAVGVAVIVILDHLLGVQLETFRGMSTFSPIWITGLIIVPLISGFAVSFIYGLGGKIVAHFPPLIAKSYAYYTLSPDVVADGASVLPIGFWVLIVIVAVEAGAAGGLIGEYVIKRTYGRRPKHLVHKRYRQESAEN